MNSEFCAIAAFSIVTAAMILVVRDTLANRRRRRLEALLPASEQIARIHDHVSSAIQNVQATLELLTLRPAIANEFATALEYYRRLQSFAAAPDASPDEVERFADEALRGMQRNRTANVNVPATARRLAMLLRQRGPG